MSAQISHDDVAAFVAEYLADPRAAFGSLAPTGDLLQEIAGAYVAARGLPRTDTFLVMTLVDSVL
jgi:hypothetical protein